MFLLRLRAILLSACFLCGLLSGGSLYAQTTWTGAINTDWATAGNWSAGVPDASDSVVIPPTTRKPVCLGGSARTINIQALASLTISATGILFVDGGTKQAILNAGTITVNSGCGIVIGSLQVSGNIGIDSRAGSTIVNSGGIVINSVSNGMRLEGVKFTNNGNLFIGQFQAGRLNGPISGYGINFIDAIDAIDNNFTNAAGAQIKIDDTGGTAFISGSNFSNSGTITIGAQSNVGSIGISNSGLFNNLGTISINRTSLTGIQLVNSTFSNAGSITIGISNGATNLIAAVNGVFNNNSGGTVNGSGNITPRFSNKGGVLSPGYSAGIITFTGDESFADGGQLTMEVNGNATAGVNYDQVVVNGKATLGSSLQVAMGYTGTNGHQIPIVVADTVLGSFLSVTGLPANWYVNYTTKAVYLVYCNSTFSFYSVTGKGVYSCGGVGLEVGLSGSQVGVNYQLKKDGVNVASPKAGTGAALSFGIQPKGNYTVLATFANGGCTAIMPGEAVVIESCAAGALNFDGANDFVSLPNALATSITADTAVTIEYWFKGSDITSALALQGANGYILSASNNKHAISSDGGTSLGLSVGAAVTDGNWHHVAMTWQKNTVNGFRSYLDGILVAQRNAGNVNLPVLSSGIRLGSYNGATGFMNGSLDELRIWKIARSQCDIQNNMNCGLAAGQSGLLAYFKFNQGIIGSGNASVTSVADSSGNNYNGTLNQFALSGTSSNWVGPGAFANGKICTESNVWLGFSADWSASSNWSLGSAPNECSRVEVNAGVSFMPTVSGSNNLCFSIKVGSGATVNFAQGAILNVAGR